MKTVNRTTVLWVAVLAWLAASTTLAAGPPRGARYASPRMAANPNAASRVTNRTSQLPPQAAPEAITAPPPADGPMDGPVHYDGDGTWDGYGDGEYFDGGYCDDGYCGSCRTGMFYFGIDYLLTRPRFSQGVAAVQQTTETIVDDDQTFVETESESVNYCFKYASSFRLNLGYRWLDCGGDIQFAYWRLTGDATTPTLGPASDDDDDLVIFAPLDVELDDGQFFQSTTSVTANIYDIDFAKILAFGGPQGCECDFCPRWDLRWSAGIRAADISRNNNGLATELNFDTLTATNVNAKFEGAGPRLGAQGRRYFGQCGMFSVFAKGSQGLLLGNYSIDRIRTNPGESQTTGLVISQHDSFCRLVPVTDIEFGASWQCSCYAVISIGWYFQAWWDLGQAESVENTNFGPLDSANILSFDGLFVRGELMF